MFGRRQARAERGTQDVSGALSGMHARLTELKERGEEVRSLVARFEKQSLVATRAVREAGRAREERDEYRRVLAASIASERRNEQRIEEMEAERLAALERSREEARLAGAASAERDTLRERLGALERLVAEQDERHARVLADLQDRAWTEREASRGELVKALTRVGEDAERNRQDAAALAAEVRAALAAATGGGAAEADRISDLRRRLMVGLGLGAMVVGIALVPPAILSAVDAERAYFVHMISHATPWHLLGGAAASFALALGLLTVARRDARRVTMR